MEARSIFVMLVAFLTLSIHLVSAGGPDRHVPSRASSNHALYSQASSSTPTPSSSWSLTKRTAKTPTVVRPKPKPVTSSVRKTIGEELKTWSQQKKEERERKRQEARERYAKSRLLNHHECSTEPDARQPAEPAHDETQQRAETSPPQAGQSPTRYESIGCGLMGCDQPFGNVEDLIAHVADVHAPQRSDAAATPGRQRSIQPIVLPLFAPGHPRRNDVFVRIEQTPRANDVFVQIEHTPRRDPLHNARTSHFDHIFTGPTASRRLPDPFDMPKAPRPAIHSREWPIPRLSHPYRHDTATWQEMDDGQWYRTVATPTQEKEAMHYDYDAGRETDPSDEGYVETVSSPESVRASGVTMQSGGSVRLPRPEGIQPYRRSAGRVDQGMLSSFDRRVT